MIRQREVKTKHKKVTPHASKSKTPIQKGYLVERIHVSLTYAVYSVYAKTNDAPHAHSSHVLDPPVYRPGVTEWPILLSKIFTGLLLVANESSSHVADQCWNVAGDFLNRSAMILLFILIMPRHNSSGAFVQHIVHCSHPTCKFFVVVVVQQSLGGWEPMYHFDMKSILQLSLAWGQSTSALNKGASEARALLARSPHATLAPLPALPRAACTCLLAAPEWPVLWLG